MSQLNGVSQGSHAPHNIVQNPASPAASQGVRPSGAAIAGRVVAGILTLGLSEVIRAVVRRVSADASAPAPRVQAPGIPAARPDADLQNSVLAEGIRGGRTLPPACQAALQEGINDLREAFGEEIIPQGTGFTSIPRYYTIRADLAKAIADAGEEVTPQQLRRMLKELATPLMAEQVLQKTVADVAQTAGYERDPSLLRISVQNAVPGLDAALKAATNRQEAEAAIATFAAAIEERVTAEKDLAELMAREEQRAITLLAEGTGLSEGTIRTRLDNKNLQDRLKYLEHDFLTGANTATGEERSNAFKAVTEAFVQNKLALWYSVDSMQLSPQLADDWKGRVLTSRELKKADTLTAFHQVGAQVDATSLLTLLNDPAITPEEIAGYMQSLALRVEDKLRSHYGLEAWEDLGADGQTMARDFAGKAMIDKVPGLAEALQARANELDTILSAQADAATDTLYTHETDPIAEEQAETALHAATAAMTLLLSDTLPAAEHNGLLIRNLGQTTMSLPHLQAMEQVIAEARIRFGEDCLPGGDIRQTLSAYDPVTRNSALHGLEKAIRESPVAVSSEDMARLTADAVHNAAVRGACISLLRESAHAMGLDVADSGLRSVMDILAQRNPGLWQNLSEAEDREDLQAQLSSLSAEVDALLRLEADMQTFWTESMNMVYAEISSNTGLPEEEVRTKLDVRDMESASLLYLRQSLRERVSNPDVVPDAFPDTVANPDEDPNIFPASDWVHKQFQERAKVFIEGKINLYASLESMELSPALKENWKEQVLTNPTLKQGDFLSLGLQTAERLHDGGLIRALGEESISNEDLLGLFQAMGMRMDTRMRDILGERIQRMGSDDTSVFSSFVRQVYLERSPDLVQAVQGHRERMERLVEAAENQMIDIQSRMSRMSARSPRMQELREEFSFLAGGMALLNSILHLPQPQEQDSVTERPSRLQALVDNARMALAAGLSLDEVMMSFIGQLSTDDAARMRVALTPRPSPGEGENTIIRTDEDLRTFIANMAFGQPGSSVSLGQTSASDGTPATLYHYNGLVFRSDGRNLSEIRNQGGMHQKPLDLSSEKILQEAQGLAFHSGPGATGQSGISMSKNLDGCVAYYAHGGGIYIIDSRQLGNGQHAYDLQAIMNSAGRAHIDTGGEVNATDVPLGAIVGCISLPGGAFNDVADTADNELKIGKLLNYITQHPEYVQLNPSYPPLAGKHA